MNNIVANFRKHYPAYAAAALLVINALVDGGYLSVPNKVGSFINAVLVATGLGVLHIRQNSGTN